MYEVDDKDVVAELEGLPQPDAGAPLPLVLSDEHTLLLAYIAHEPDPAWDGSYVSVVSDSTPAGIVIVKFRGYCAHMFGPPDEETVAGHPLAKRGLFPYSVFEVSNSSWLRRLERMNSVHRSHDAARFLAGKRHLVFTFHDSTFECIVRDVVAEGFRGSMREAAGRMVTMLRG